MILCTENMYTITILVVKGWMVLLYENNFVVASNYPSIKTPTFVHTNCLHDGTYSYCIA
jgi:hypothetical protein